MTPQIITTLVIIAAMFALMLLNKFPLAVTMTLAGVALWITGIVEPAKLYSSFGGSTIIFLIGMSIEVYALEATGLVDMAAANIFRGKVVEKERLAVFVTCLFSGIITGFIGAFKAYSDAVALFGTDLNAAGMNTLVGFVYDMLYGRSGGYPSYASAAAIFLFAIVLTITCVNLLVSKKHVHYV